MSLSAFRTRDRHCSLSTTTTPAESYPRYLSLLKPSSISEQRCVLRLHLQCHTCSSPRRIKILLLFHRSLPTAYCFLYRPSQCQFSRRCVFGNRRTGAYGRTDVDVPANDSVADITQMVQLRTAGNFRFFSFKRAFVLPILSIMSYELTQFDFLGYTFRKRSCRAKSGKLFVGFSPAVSEKAKKAIRQTIRSWRIHLWSSASLESIAKELNPIIRGWLQYYGRFNRYELRFSLQQNR